MSNFWSAVQLFSDDLFVGLLHTSILLGVKVSHLLQAGQCQKKTWDLKWQLRIADIDCSGRLKVLNCTPKVGQIPSNSQGAVFL